MEIKEKMDIFFETAIEAANTQSQEILEEYKMTYQERILEYEQKKQKEQATRERIEEARIRREINRSVSEQVLHLKRVYHEQTAKKKEILFARVLEKISEYQKTEAYQDYLVRKIQSAKRFAKDEVITIYLNISDAALKDVLEEKTGCTLTMSEIDFMGGIRAVIRSKNVLIDESFKSKLEQEREAYSF